jgi:hypothetical protein
MSENHIEIIIEILQSKKEEILNYDMSEEWANETLDAIQAFINENY